MEVPLYSACPVSRLSRAGVGLRALARCRHGHGRHGYDRVPYDPGWHGNHGAGERAMERDRVRIRVRHVGGDDGDDCG
jgi:hypothetical protein